MSPPWVDATGPEWRTYVPPVLLLQPQPSVYRFRRPLGIIVGITVERAIEVAVAAKGGDALINATIDIESGPFSVCTYVKGTIVRKIDKDMPK